MTKVKKYDLSSFNQSSERQRFLKPVEEVSRNIVEEKNKIEVRKESKKERPNKAAKVGRPMAAEEPLTEKVSINLTSKEMKKLRDQIGLVPVASYLRNILKENRII